uniref:Uncharacterized protein n=1 Tax=Nothobranchius kadleci TaxID=1051664 RepID=A0A1A8DUV5_NOTKA
MGKGLQRLEQSPGGSEECPRAENSAEASFTRLRRYGDTERRGAAGGVGHMSSL